MTNSEKRMIESKSKRSFALLLILVLLVLGGFWYFFDTGKKPQAISPEPTPQAEKLAEDQTGEKAAAARGEKSAATGSEESGAPAVSECGKAAEQIQKFFTHLDSSDYIAARNLPGGSHAYFSGLTDKTLASPPVLTREKESLQAILSNTAHFYRTLKIADIALIKEILANENDALEDLMALFYNWSEIAPKCPDSGVLVQLPLPGLYEYAGFFLNTIGGQSYLFRRDSRTRLLLKFYSVKIMNRAEDASLNRYGVDFRPAIDSLIEEMKSAPNLTKKDDYLAELIVLQDKYSRKFGGQETQSASGSHQKP